VSGDRFQEVERLCSEALELPESERAAFLARSGVEESVRVQVEALLEAQSSADRIFSGALVSGPSVEVEDDVGLNEEIGDIGPYEILEKLGEGGMGMVFRAKQSAPVLREVALKVIRPGMASAQWRNRFEVERQALAMMDHPNIARVFDAGATSLGLPYMAMEFVQGQSLTRYCQGKNLSPQSRIRLIIPVCHAIQHAHQKGILHRDIKPGNVLVAEYDGQPLAKVIDFGIAKGIEGALPSSEGVTRAGVMIGTLDYMSPEQAEAGPTRVDTRSDIYSLGALMYEVLSGSAPIPGLSIEQATYSEILRRIREETPVALSARAPGLKAPELDWIVAKALEKDPERRYSSADSLAKDLERYLEGEAVEAGPASGWYRATKFAARHRYWIGAGAVVAAVLVFAFVWMFFALQQQRRANENAVALRQVVRKIIVERPAQLAQIPNRTALRAELMRDAEGALEALSRDSGNDPAAQWELANAYMAIGNAKGSYSSQGSEGAPAEAAVYVEKAIALYSKLAAAKSNDAAIRRAQLEALGTSLHLKYIALKLDEGVKLAGEIQALVEGMSPELRKASQADWYLALSQVELGAFLFRLQEPSKAIAANREAAKIIRESYAGGLPQIGNDNAESLASLSRIHREVAINTWMFAGAIPEAQSAAKRSVELLQACKTTTCRMRCAQAQGTYGELLWATGERAKGVATMRESLSTFAALQLEDPANVVYRQAGAQVRDYLALMLAKSGGGEEAVALVEANLRLPPAPEANQSRGRERLFVHEVSLGGALLGALRWAAAEAQLKKTLAVSGGYVPNDDLRWSALHLLCSALVKQGKFEEAVSTALEARKFAERSKGEAVSVKVRRAWASADYALAIGLSPSSTAQQRAEALAELDSKNQYLNPNAVLTGALLEHPPDAGELARIRRMLVR
jgi:tetratricopeptide (TPR) repeat protein/predicted Ser/Thr protein kinase